MADATLIALGKGEVYFDRFVSGTRAGTGELYIGNTKSFVTERSVERTESFTSYRGQKIKKPGFFASESHTVIFQTDNMSPENYALWYGGENSLARRISVTATSDTFVAKSGRYFQLGKSVRPQGVRPVTNIVVKRAGVVIPSSGNYEAEEETGRVRILKDGVLSDGDAIVVTADWPVGYTNTQVAVPQDQFGALRFVGRAGYGPLVNYFYPMVRLSCSGPVDKKSDDWQTLTFSADALKMSPLSEFVYVENFVSFTDDESAILISGGVETGAFLYYEDILDDTTNVRIPSHAY